MFHKKFLCLILFFRLTIWQEVTLVFSVLPSFTPELFALSHAHMWCKDSDLESEKLWPHNNHMILGKLLNLL